MYFKDFPRFLYDFNYGGGVSRTNVVVDITRNIRFRRDILSNIGVYDEYDIIDGETPEILSEKFYGTQEYHWVIMLANEKYDYRKDFPLTETVLQKHIATSYNPILKSSDWYWATDNHGQKTLYIRITSVPNPFDPAYLISNIGITISDTDRSWVQKYNYIEDGVTFNIQTQYFGFKINIPDSWLLSHGKTGATSITGIGNDELTITTTGREHNPVYFVDVNNNIINPGPNAIPVTGDTLHRQENDAKRRIKIISPTLIESILRNYEDDLA